MFRLGFNIFLGAFKVKKYNGQSSSKYQVGHIELVILRCLVGKHWLTVTVIHKMLQLTRESSARVRNNEPLSGKMVNPPEVGSLPRL